MSFEIVIKPGANNNQYWKDIWEYRELLKVLAWRDIAVRYKQTIFGILWAVLRPLITMAAFTIVFGKIAKLPSEGDVPYSLMVFAGMLPWQLFTTALSGTSESLLSNTSLVSKVYFPRILIPTSTVAVAFVDFFFSFLILIGMMLFLEQAITLKLFLILPLALIAMLIALGPGLLFCALNVKYRDFRYILPFIIQFGLYVSPVGFSSKIIEEKWRWIYELNPMVGVIEAFRWVIAGQGDMPTHALTVSCVFAVISCLIGITFFRKTERTFADII